MANVSVSAPAASGLRFRFGTFIDGFVAGLVRIADSNSKYRQMQALMALSDAQLADRGLRREDIARYVFRDQLYL